MNNYKGSRLIKNSVFNLFNTFFMMSTSWVISIWVARQLGPSNYGILNMVLWFTDTVTWVIGMGLIHAVTKFVAEYHGKGENDCTGAIVVFVLKIELALSVAVTSILIIFQTPIADYFFTPKESLYFFIAFLGILPGISTAVFSSAIDGIQKFEYFTYANLIIYPLSFISKIIVLALGKGIVGLMLVMLFFSIVNVIFYGIILKKEGVLSIPKFNKKMDVPLKKRIFSYNRSVIAILMCDKIVWDRSENFFLGRLCNSIQIGYYNLGFNIAQKTISILPYTFWRVLFPAMSGFSGSGDTEKMKRLFYLSTRYLAFITIPMGAAGIILAYPLIHFMYGHNFIGAQRTLQIIFFSSIISSLANPGSAILYGYEKQAFIYKYGFCLAIFNIALDIFLIKSHGALGAAIAYGITTIFASVGGLFYTCRTMHLAYPFVSLVKVLFCTIIMAIAMETVIIHNRELVGFISSIACGIIVYCVGALTLGAFEKEDFVLLNSISQILPENLGKKLILCINFLENFKQGKEKN